MSWADVAATLLSGFQKTLALVAISAVLALLFGIGLAIMQVAPVTILRRIASIIIGFVRNIPSAVFLFFVIFVIPQFGFHFTFFIGAAVAITIYYGAYFGEVIRAGIRSVGRGQIEAARSIGLRFLSVIALIVLPQAMRSAVPPLLNTLIAVVRTTSVAGAFGVSELYDRMRFAANARPDIVIPILIGTAALYLVITLPVIWLARRLERRVVFVR